MSDMPMRRRQDYEYVVATDLLRGQAEDYGLRLANGLPAQLPRTQRLSGYTRADVPPRYAAFPMGVHEDAAEERVHVGVFDTSAGRLYFSIDLGDIEALERLLGWALAAVVVLGTFLSGFLGWLFTGAARRSATTSSAASRGRSTAISAGWWTPTPMSKPSSPTPAMSCARPSRSCRGRPK